MLASAYSVQKVIFALRPAPRTALLSAALVAALGCALPAAADSEKERCQQLYGTWQRYKGVSTNSSGRDVRSQSALQDCRSGRAAAGIAALEQLLRDDRIPVPQVSSAAR